MESGNDGGREPVRICLVVAWAAMFAVFAFFFSHGIFVSLFHEL
jgi:hypothetical protein